MCTDSRRPHNLHWHTRYLHNRQYLVEKRTKILYLICARQFVILAASGHLLPVRLWKKGVTLARFRENVIWSNNKYFLNRNISRQQITSTQYFYSNISFSIDNYYLPSSYTLFDYSTRGYFTSNEQSVLAYHMLKPSNKEFINPLLSFLVFRLLICELHPASS